MERYRFAWRPQWLAWHLFCLAAAVTMVLLGRWQLVVSDEKHFNIRNFGYALQWWAFAAFTAWIWFRVVRDHGRAAAGAGEAQPTNVPAAGESAEPVAYRRYVVPSVQPDPQADPEVAAYNDYLARLADKDAHEQ